MILLDAMADTGYAVIHYKIICINVEALCLCVLVDKHLTPKFVVIVAQDAGCFVK